MSVARSLSTARSGASEIANRSSLPYASGWSRARVADSRAISARARSTVAFGASRPKTSVMRCVREVTIAAPK